jgi:hypothetical protein
VRPREAGKGKSGENKADAAPGAPSADILSRTTIKLEVN